jgi:hypothetical protein
MTPNLHETLATLVADVAGDVDVWQLERAYLTAGGPLLSVASRIGYPAADLFLDFTLAVRAMLRDNADPAAREKARAHYEQMLSRVQGALDRMQASA